MEQFLQFLTDFFVAISPALQTLLQAVVVALAGVITAWVTKLYQTQKTKLSLGQQEILDLVVANAVVAAQQVAKTGEEKLAYSFDIAEKALARYGITVDADVIYAMIEAKVFDNKEMGRFG
jgi:hypothetical protein